MGKYLFFICLLFFACSNNKNLAQTAEMSNTDSLAIHINSSHSDTELIIPHLKKWQAENDLVIAFGSLNYAWARKGTYTVLARKDNAWKLYLFEARLPPTPEDEAVEPPAQTVPADTANSIVKQYERSELWKTRGDEDEPKCPGKQNCNVNDAATWIISVSTPEKIHSTIYYAPDILEECCPGNTRRKHFIDIAHAMMKLAEGKSNLPDR